MIRRQALYLLFSQHTFRVRVSWPYRQPEPSQWAVNDSIFLLPIPQDGLRYLRHLRWVFPPGLDPTAFLPGQPETEDLEKAVGYLASGATLGHLTVVLDFWDSLVDSESEDETGSGQNKDLEGTWKLYQRIVQLLLPLHGLENLFIYLREPYGDDAVCNEHEQILEKMVMGPDYDSSMRGKNLPDNNDIWELSDDDVDADA